MSDTQNMKIGFLGPRGTYTEEALQKLLNIDDHNLVPYGAEADVLRAVERGEVAKGMVPIENSIEGSVNATLDVLAFDVNLFIQREIVIPIHHNLVARPGVKMEDIRTVISHPQALAQCRGYLTEKLPQAKTEFASSTAGAVKLISEQNGALAAIGPKLAAEMYGLDVLDEGIADFEENQTRFVLVGKEPAPRTGNDKTSIVCFIFEDRPGSLLQILQEFAFRYVNLTKIQSRPTRKALGDYCFFIDMLGHIEDEVIESALKCLKCKIRNIKVLGSYPVADVVGG
ncbi:MAG: prephenate dehydratase [Actinomycetota bacterium]|nr:prephenate dehydratase [Actinomycetota bacterium]